MIKIGPVQECTKVVKRRDYLSTAYDYKNSKKKKKIFLIMTMKFIENT